MIITNLELLVVLSFLNFPMNDFLNEDFFGVGVVVVDIEGGILGGRDSLEAIGVIVVVKLTTEFFGCQSSSSNFMVVS